MTATRHVYQVPLQPVLGSTFQPTGFPDLGAATFDRPNNDDSGTTPHLLVESVQSMANRLENTAWDTGNRRPVPAVAGLPYIDVRRAGTGEYLTSSRTEAHRLFSAFIRDSTWDGDSGDKQLLQRLGLKPETPLDRRGMAATIMALDPFSLLHGVFFAGPPKGTGVRANWPAQPKFMRAVTAVIEASDVHRVVYGGRKADHVRHQNDETAGSKEGYGSVPFHRTEWTARAITASFSVDIALIRSYGLPEPGAELLETLALWEIRTLLDGGLRLRTACDLEVAGDIKPRRGAELPQADELTNRLRHVIDAAAPLLADGKATTVTWPAPGAKTKASAKTRRIAETGDDDAQDQ